MSLFDPPYWDRVVPEADHDWRVVSSLYVRPAHTFRKIQIWGSCASALPSPLTFSTSGV